MELQVEHRERGKTLLRNTILVKRTFWIFLLLSVIMVILSVTQVIMISKTNELIKELSLTRQNSQIDSMTTVGLLLNNVTIPVQNKTGIIQSFSAKCRRQFRTFTEEDNISEQKLECLDDEGGSLFQNTRKKILQWMWSIMVQHCISISNNSIPVCQRQL